MPFGPCVHQPLLATHPKRDRTLPIALTPQDASSPAIWSPDRLWDRRTMSQVHAISTAEPVTFMEKSDRRGVLTLAVGTVVAFYDLRTCVREHDARDKRLSSFDSLTILLTPCAHFVWDPREAVVMSRMAAVKTFDLGTKVLSASLHSSLDRFVAGGADCHLHVHDATTGLELGPFTAAARDPRVSQIGGSSNLIWSP